MAQGKAFYFLGLKRYAAVDLSRAVGAA